MSKNSNREKRRNVLVADDHLLIRESLERLLEERLALNILSGVADGGAVLDKLEADTVDLLFLDLRLPRMSGLELLDRLVSLETRPRVVVCSGVSSGVDFAHVDRLGVEGIVSKEDDNNVMIEAARAALAGRKFRSPRIQELIAPLTDISFVDGNPLTRREREVAALIAEGLHDAQIASMLGVARKTIKKHRENIRCKLGARSGVDIARAASRLGLTGD